MSQDKLSEVAERRHELGGEGLAVFLLLISASDYENEVKLSQAQIASRLGMLKQNVSRSLTKLVSIGAIVEGERFGKMKSYRIHPTYGWKGKGPAHIKGDYALYKPKLET